MSAMFLAPAASVFTEWMTAFGPRVVPDVNSTTAGASRARTT